MATLALAPVVFVQGRLVRWRIPKLPEPEGAREGVWGAGSDLRLLILGDSAAAGVGVSSQAEALSGRVVGALGEFHRVHWKLLAESGHSSDDILKRLQNAPAEPFDVVVVSVGVNDVTGMTGSRRWRRNLQQITQLLIGKFKARRILYSNLPPMHLFPALPQPLRWWLGTRADRLNRQIEQFASQHPNCGFVTVQFPLQRDYVATDGFHPGAAAYALWGHRVVAMIRENMLAPAIVMQ